MAAEIAGIAGVPAPQVLSVQGVPGGAPIPVTPTGGTGDVNIVEYGGVLTSLGQKPMASSIPVTLASDQGPLPVTVSAGTDRTATGSITNTQTVEINTQASGACGVQLSGVWTGTVVFEATVNGSIWNPVLAVNSVSGDEVTSTTANGNWVIACAGFQKVRARGNTVTSGSATVFLDASTCPQVVTLGGPIPKGSATIGHTVTRGGAKGTTVEADVTSTPSGPNHQILDVAIYDAAGNQITSFGGSTQQYPDGAARGTATGTLAMGDDGTNIQSLSCDPTGKLNLNNISGTISLPTGAATEATLATRAAAAQLPAALVGGRLDENVGAWLGSTAPTVGQKAMAASLPVTLASDQGSVPVTITPNVVGVQGNAWNAAAVAAAGVSASIDCQYTPNISVFGNTSGTTKITVQFSQDNVNFYDATEQNIPSGGDFSISGAWGARYIRLKSSQARTITATVAGKG